MNKKERIHAALEGKPVDQMPVAVPYVFLYHIDHFAELTGRPQMQSFAWRHMEPEEHTEILKHIVQVADFDIVQPQDCPTRRVRQNTDIREIDGRWFQVDKQTGSRILLEPVSGHAFDEKVNQTQLVFTKEEARSRIKPVPVERALAEGANEYIEAAVSALGREHFILSGGVLGTFYACVEHLGLTNLFTLAAAEPELIDYMCKLNLEKLIEHIRLLARAGGDAIYIDDATTTNDILSRKAYERFSLPYVKEMVDEIHRQGHKAIAIYFGGIADRLDLIAALGADGLIVETSMKNYTNDIGEIARKIGGRVTLFGNINPLGILQDGSDAELEAEIRRQVRAGRQGRGFILSTGSPVTPKTPFARIRRFIESGRSQ